MTNITIIGLGIMGLPMAKNLVKAGYTVTGVNRSPEAVQKLVDAGGNGAASVAEGVKDADVIITMVPDSPDVADVVQGPEGVFANAKKGALWIDNSSIRPDVAKELAEEAVEDVRDRRLAVRPRHTEELRDVRIGPIDPRRHLAERGPGVVGDEDRQARIGRERRAGGVRQDRHGAAGARIRGEGGAVHPRARDADVEVTRVDVA